MTNGGYITIIAIILGVFIFRECEHSSERSLLIESMASQEQYFKTEMESMFAGKEILVQEVKEVKQNLVKSIDEIKILKDQYPDLKKIQAVIKTELINKIKRDIEYRYDTTYLAADTSRLIPRDSVMKHFIPKGTKATYNELWYDVAITLGDSLSIDSLVVREKVDAILAWKKPDKSFKWLRKKEPVVSIQSYNPYTDIGYVNNLVVKEEKSKFAKVLTSKPMMVVYGIIGFATYNSLK